MTFQTATRIVTDITIVVILSKLLSSTLAYILTWLPVMHLLLTETVFGDYAKAVLLFALACIFLPDVLYAILRAFRKIQINSKTSYQTTL